MHLRQKPDTQTAHLPCAAETFVTGAACRLVEMHLHNSALATLTLRAATAQYALRIHAKPDEYIRLTTDRTMRSQ